MTEDFPIVIPTMGRANGVLTLKKLPNAIVCPPKSEAAAYAKTHPDATIVSHPDSIKGIHAKRQWIYDKWGTVFMVDDDIVDWQDATSVPPRSMETDEVESRIQRLLEETIDAGCFLCGFAPYADARLFKEFAPFGMTGFTNAYAIGLVKGAKFHYNLTGEMRGADDYWISCLNAYYHRMIWRDQRVCTVTKDLATNVGGMAAIRTIDVERTDTAALRRAFGDAVTKRKVVVRPTGNSGTASPNIASQRNPYQRSFKVPF